MPDTEDSPTTLTPAEYREIDKFMDRPDGWMIVHHRGTETSHFGPWATLEDAHEWWGAVGRLKGVTRAFRPLYRQVDWSRPW